MSDIASKPIRTTTLALAALAAFAAPALAADLVVATIRAAEDRALEFRVTGKSRDDLVGGEILLGEAVYRISRVSRHGLVGARRMVSDEGGSFGEFVVFSSSYSSQTAVGTPWVAAHEARHCDEPYNAFLAVYRVDGEAAVASLGPIPYPKLIEDIDRSRQSRVYCFMGRVGAQ